jgi:protein-tyrosine phosphatase
MRIYAEPHTRKETPRITGAISEPATIAQVSGYVDIHAHVLPAIDDGPGDLQASLELLRAAADAGTTAIAATPHLRSDFPDVHVHELSARCGFVREAVEEAGIPIRLVQGAEVSLSWALDASEEELRLASYDQRGTDLLIETPSSNILGFDRLLYEFRARGYRITLAHPERNAQFASHEDLLRSLVDRGVLLQINAESLLGPAGRAGHRRFARYLCTEGLAHIIASDGHRAGRWRPVTELGEAAGPAAELVGPERARWMLEEGPAAVLAGSPLPAPPSIEGARRRRRFFARR